MSRRDVAFVAFGRFQTETWAYHVGPDNMICWDFIRIQHPCHTGDTTNRLRGTCVNDGLQGIHGEGRIVLLQGHHIDELHLAVIVRLLVLLDVHEVVHVVVHPGWHPLAELALHLSLGRRFSFALQICPLSLEIRSDFHLWLKTCQDSSGSRAFVEPFIPAGS